MKPTEPMRNLLTAIERANRLALKFGLQFFAYVSDGNQKEHLASNVVLSDLETVIGGLREWRTGPIPEPTCLCVLILETNNRSEAHASFEHSLDGYVFRGWNGVNGMKLREYIQKDPRGIKFTGRWFIQPITLPCSDPTNPKQ